ncbi:hypothetical protein A2U01_0065681, partial [Trifolium medium]|nr:hypothetical protein [Trifolium medium]
MARKAEIFKLQSALGARRQAVGARRQLLQFSACSVQLGAQRA